MARRVVNDKRRKNNLIACSASGSSARIAGQTCEELINHLGGVALEFDCFFISEVLQSNAGEIAHER